MYGTAEEYFYGIISSQPHVKYSQCFLMAGIKWFFFTSCLSKGGSGISETKSRLKRLIFNSSKGRFLPPYPSSGVITSAYFFQSQ